MLGEHNGLVAGHNAHQPLHVSDGNARSNVDGPSVVERNVADVAPELDVRGSLFVKDLKVLQDVVVQVEPAVRQDKLRRQRQRRVLGRLQDVVFGSATRRERDACRHALEAPHSPCLTPVPEPARAPGARRIGSAQLTPPTQARVHQFPWYATYV